MPFFSRSPSVGSSCRSSSSMDRNRTRLPRGIESPVPPEAPTQITQNRTPVARGHQGRCGPRYTTPDMLFHSVMAGLGGIESSRV